MQEIEQIFSFDRLCVQNKKTAQNQRLKTSQSCYIFQRFIKSQKNQNVQLNSKNIAIHFVFKAKRARSMQPSSIHFHCCFASVIVMVYGSNTLTHAHVSHIQFSTIFISKSTKYELNRRKHLHLFCSFTRSHSIFIRSFEHWHCDTSRVRATMQEEEAHNDIDDNNRI